MLQTLKTYLNLRRNNMDLNGVAMCIRHLFMLRSDFKQCMMDTCIYTRGTGQSRIILGIHVEDQAIVWPDKKVIDKFKFKWELANEF